MIENKCTVQGCCVPSEYLILPKQSDSSNPDLKSPNMALEVLKVLINAPYALALFLCGVGRHIFYKSKRPTWDFNTMINIESIQIARTMLKWNHTFIWRIFLSIAPVKPISDVKKITCMVPKGTHCGIFQKCSEEEDGARTLQADWLTCNNPANKDKIIYYIHGGGFALFDRRCFNNLSTKFRDTFQRDVFGNEFSMYTMLCLLVANPK